MGFGEYLRDLRKSKHVTQQQIANELGKTAMSVCAVENDKNAPFCPADLEKIANLLELDEKGKNELFRMAAKARKTLPSDMINYVNSTDEAFQLLDICVDRNLTSESLKKIIEYAEGIHNV